MSNRGNRIEVYRDAANEWRWHAVSRNGHIVADSGQGYGGRAGKWHAKRAAKRHGPQGWPVVVIGPS